MADQKVAVVIPTLNEEKNITPLLEELFPVLKDTASKHIVIVVDGGSNDKTVELARELAAREKLLVMEAEGPGLGSAYLTGLKTALRENARIIAGMDADLSHPPSLLPSLLTPLQEADIAVGTREEKAGLSASRKLVSAFANILSRRLLNLPLRDATSGYRAYRREVLESIDLDSFLSQGFAFQVEILYKARKKGFKIAEVPIVFPPRKWGESKLSFKDILEFMKVSLQLAVGG